MIDTLRHALYKSVEALCQIWNPNRIGFGEPNQFMNTEITI